MKSPPTQPPPSSRTLFPPPSACVLEVLRKSGGFEAPDSLQVLPRPTTPTRRDASARSLATLVHREKPVWHLIVGQDLAGLRERAQAFAAACPTIACKPLFWQESNGWQYLALEHFDGESLETLIARGALNAAEARAHAGRVLCELQKTAQPSTPLAAHRELDALFERINRLPLFDLLDAGILQTIIFPAIRAGVVPDCVHTQWTNGDLIARNLLVNRTGEIRLIDYEFAECTHFHAADTWRWRNFSHLPSEALTLPGPTDESLWNPALESLCHLLQLEQQYAVHGPRVALEESQTVVRRLLALAREDRQGFRTSAFFGALVATAPIAPVAQLYWGNDHSYAEDRSQQLPYDADVETVLRFTTSPLGGPVCLRLDPTSMPGLLHVTSIEVKCHATGASLLTLNQANHWNGLSPVNGLLRLRPAATLDLLSLDNDPHLFLPDLPAGASSRALTCEVRLHFSRKLSSLPKLLPATP